MTKEDFLKNDSSYYGETVDDMDQVMYRNFNGEELKEYVEHHIQEQVKAGVTSEGDWSKCPFCESDNLHQFELKHGSCKDCKEQWTN